MIRDCFKKNLVIESPRLTLRPIEKNDVGDILEVYSCNDLMRYYHRPPFTTIDEAKEHTENLMRAQKEQSMIHWGLELRSTGRLVGVCGFHSFSEESKKARIDFDATSKLKGYGLVREALLVILHFMFTSTDINRIEIFVESANTSAATLLSKLGFTKEGEMRQYALRRESLTDMSLWALLREDWNAKQEAESSGSVLD